MLHVSNLSQSEVLSTFKTYEDKGWFFIFFFIYFNVWLTPIVFVLLAYFTKESCSSDYVIRML